MADRFQEESCDFFQMSELITKGPPDQYRLLTTRSNLNDEGSVRKWTFGQRNISKENKIILMVGETGTGKTTLINSLVNYILGVKFTDHIWFKITDETESQADQTADETESKTDKITVYEFFSQDSRVSLTIIDTPGFGSTSGTEFDENIAVNLYKLFNHETGVKELDAVCLVLKASTNRLSDRQFYIFDAILSSFGKDIENNIVIFVTHSDGLFPKNAINAIKKAKIPCKKNKENNPDFFLFNNYEVENAENDGEALQKYWTLKERSFSTFLCSLEKQNRKSLDQTKSLLTERVQLKAFISNIHEKIRITEKKRDKQIQIQIAIDNNKEKILSGENFTFTVTKCQKEKVLINNASWWDRKVTYCNHCQENCHEFNCWCAPTAEFCWVMKNDFCTVCTDKCKYTEHKKENMKFVSKDEKEVIAYTSLKKLSENQDGAATSIKFDLKAYKNVKDDIESNKKQKTDLLLVQKSIQESISRLNNEKIELIKEAHTTIQKLCDIALQPDSAYIVESLDFLIPRAEESEMHDHAQELKELRKMDAESEGKAFKTLRYMKGGVDKVTGFFSRKK